MTKAPDKTVIFSLFFIGIKRKGKTMTIVKKWEIEKGKGYTVFIGAHVIQKGEQWSVNKYIVRYRITSYFIQSYKCSSSYFRKCLTIFTWIYRQLIFVNTDFTVIYWWSQWFLLQIFQIRTFFSFGIFLFDSFTMFCCEVVAKLDKL